MQKHKYRKVGFPRLRGCFLQKGEVLQTQRPEVPRDLRNFFKISEGPWDLRSLKWSLTVGQGGENSEDNGQGPDADGDGSGSQEKQLSTSVRLEARDGLIRDPTCAHEWPKDSTHISCEARNTKRPFTCAGLTG